MQEAIKTATANPPLPNPNPHYGQGYTYGQPNLRYAVGVGPELPPPQGAKVKLDLFGRNDLNLFQLAQGHISAMAGNLNFTTPFPAGRLRSREANPALPGFASHISLLLLLETQRAHRARLQLKRISVSLVSH